VKKVQPLATKPPVDWEAVETLYRAGRMSLRDIAKKHGTAASTIKLRAQKGGWVSNATGTKARVVADAMAGVKAGMKPEELKRSREHAAAEDLEDMGVALNTHRRVLRAMETASTLLGADPDTKVAKVIAETTEKAVDGIRRIRGLDTKDKPATSEELDERIKAELAKLDPRREKAIP
jgi:hypothetical protein